MQRQRIVVGVDFSASAVSAATWVARHFEATELTLVHAVYVAQPPSFLRGRLPPVEMIVENAREGATTRLRELAVSLGRPRVDVEVRVGQPVDVLAAVARDRVADLVVVGKHGERAGLWGRLGSTAERLVQSSPVPVLLAPGIDEHRPSHVLAAIDDSDATSRVLAAASALADRFDADVTALHVVSSAVLSHVLSMAAAAGQAELSPPEVQEEFRLDTDRWIHGLIEAGVNPQRARSEVAFGEPAQEILSAVERLRADLVVIGSRGAGAVRRTLLGSVVSEVVREATCPVLVVGEPEDEVLPRLSEQEIEEELPNLARRA